MLRQRIFFRYEGSTLTNETMKYENRNYNNIAIYHYSF